MFNSKWINSHSPHNHLVISVLIEEVQHWWCIQEHVGIPSLTLGGGDQSFQQEEGCRTSPACPVRAGSPVQKEEVALCV